MWWLCHSSGAADVVSTGLENWQLAFAAFSRKENIKENIKERAEMMDRVGYTR